MGMNYNQYDETNTERATASASASAANQINATTIMISPSKVSGDSSSRTSSNDSGIIVSEQQSAKEPLVNDCNHGTLMAASYKSTNDQHAQSSDSNSNSDGINTNNSNNNMILELNERLHPNEDFERNSRIEEQTVNSIDAIEKQINKQYSYNNNNIKNNNSNNKYYSNAKGAAKLENVVNITNRINCNDANIKGNINACNSSNINLSTGDSCSNITSDGSSNNNSHNNNNNNNNNSFSNVSNSRLSNVDISDNSNLINSNANDNHNDNNNVNAKNPSNNNNHNNNNESNAHNSQKRIEGQNCSPALSIRSTSISIVSIDENAIDSSVIDSDSDCMDVDAEGAHGNYVVKKLGQQVTYQPGNTDVPDFQKGLTVIGQSVSPAGLGVDTNLSTSPLARPPIPPLPHDIVSKVANGNLAVTPTTPQIGSIALTNSTDVTFGDKHFYEGPVTIQQFLIDRRDKAKDGQDNPSFVKDENLDPQNRTNGTQSAQHGQPYKFIFNRRAIVITGTIIALIVLIGIIILTTTNIFRSSKRKYWEESTKNIPINSTIDEDNIGSGKILRLVERLNWLAQPPARPLEPLKLPISQVMVAALGTSECSTQAECVGIVRLMQTYNIESQSKTDILYNFLIGGDGNVYVGRGWDFVGAHMDGYNDVTISFAFIGSFKDTKPNVRQLDVTKLLLQEGVKLNKLSENYKIYCPEHYDSGSNLVGRSKKLCEIFKEWPHWSK